ncbi:MAG: hypothetical protein K2W79_10685 [Hydrotalea flava]|nr:hypothetical protein [Hydrotalea flava]
MQGIAKELPAADPRKKMLQRAAIAHLNASLPHIASRQFWRQALAGQFCSLCTITVGLLQN